MSSYDPNKLFNNSKNSFNLKDNNDLKKIYDMSSSSISRNGGYLSDRNLKVKMNNNH